MPTQPRSPAEHYAESARLLAVAESAGTDPTVQSVAALAGIGHAILAGAPRRARRSAPKAAHVQPPRARWLFGDDQDGQS